MDPTFRPVLDTFSHLELESLPSGGWGYDHFPLTVRYARNLGLDHLGMTGKFHKTWAGFGEYKNPAALEYECFTSLAEGSKVSIGDQLPEKDISTLLQLLVSPMSGKRDIEDRFTHALADRRHPVFARSLDRIRHAKWYVLSARRANQLLREKLFDRVYAVRVPGFARLFGKAELDMHFSLKEDLRDLHGFLMELREGGLQRASSMLERGAV